MQAGESLSFINRPYELEVKPNQPETEKQLVWREFTGLVQSILTHRPEHTRTMQHAEKSGIITVKEASYRIKYNDQSYLHFVAYAHQDEIGYLDLNLSIMEHDSEGGFLGGYLYETGQDEIIFSHQPRPDFTEEELLDDEEKYHFSLIDMYQSYEETYEQALLGDGYDAQEARDLLNTMQQEAEVGLMERDLALSYSNPSPEDIYKLQVLCGYLEPFTP